MHTTHKTFEQDGKLELVFGNIAQAEQQTLITTYCYVAR